eukprot:TRINITY_DN3377_c0_g1_i1.p1 TRINITY_DN3377_c0_g1~~TRINITY_DN3377_c0_g1_i1.p1  ORF type:complete len:468 (-),score=144.21 TRINITY_DN3377_c0_g1_i1:817-2220(-)
MASEAAPLMVTISGIRGIYGKSLVGPVVQKYVAAFCALQRSRGLVRGGLVVGRDSRTSGPEVEATAVEAMLAQGMDVGRCGVVPTPTVQVMVQQLRAAGGVVITSSHNPAPWNGLKFVDADGLFLSPDMCNKMFAMADKPETIAAPGTARGSEHAITDAIETHLKLILDLPFIDAKKIAERHLRVCVDTVCGAGGPIITTLLKRLGCDVVALHSETSGIFPHEPEPVPRNLGELCAAVIEHHADLGIAVDPDVDRCVLIDEHGKPLVEEYTLALATEFILGVVGRRGPVCKNLSTTRAVDDVAAKYGCTMYATAVGEINVAKKMAEVNAVVGGEGNGGVMLPDVHIGRDAPVATALTLAHLAAAGPGVSLSALKRRLSQYDIVKVTVPLAGVDVASALDAVKAEWAQKGKIDETDGIHISTKDWWVHLRKSNTEPIIRVIGEAHTEAEATEICERFKQRICSFRSRL